jgi:hypothetical protein
MSKILCEFFFSIGEIKSDDYVSKNRAGHD